MRVVSAEEAVAGIRSREQIYLQCASATPSVLLDALVGAGARARGRRVVHLHCEGPGPHLAPDMAAHFRHRALFIGPNARAAVNEGRADYVPVFLSDVPRLFDGGHAAPRRRLRQRDAARRRTASARWAPRVEAMHAAIRAAKTVIVQFNAAMPRTLGESFIHVDDIDLAVECDVPPYEYPMPADRRDRAADRRATWPT